MEHASRGFAKLDSGIVDSTLWMEDHDVLRVWIALMAKSDAYGVVRVSVPALAHLCMMTVERFEQIEAKFCAPDPYSRTPDNEGRRLRKVDGGWVLLNYLTYRDLMQRKAASHAERQKRYRDKIAARDANVTVAVTRDVAATMNVTRDLEAEAEAEAEERAKESTPIGVEVITSRDDPCPLVKIVALFHESLPTLPRVEKITKTRAGYLRQRWREDLSSIDEWRNFFDYVGQSQFLMGRAKGRDGQPPFLATLEWITRPGNYAKIAEGKYHGR